MFAFVCYLAAGKSFAKYESKQSSPKHLVSVIIANTKEYRFDQCGYQLHLGFKFHLHPIFNCEMLKNHVFHFNLQRLIFLRRVCYRNMKHLVIGLFWSYIFWWVQLLFFFMVN